VLSFVFVDLIADHATDYGTTDRAACAAAGEHATRDGACSCTNSGILVLR